MAKPGRLYLFPVTISESEVTDQIPKRNISLIQTLTYFIAEDAKTARRFLKKCDYPKIENAEIVLLNEHTKPSELNSIFKLLIDGHDVGLMSDAGCPGIADPGAEIVHLAHQRGLEVIPLVGPSSIVLSIMASGFNGQNFAFVGYLPIDKSLKIKRLKELEQLVVNEKQAQFFIETPYRNDQLFESILNSLAPERYVFIGRDLGSKNEFISSKTVANWKKIEAPNLQKIPVVFGIY